ncbi:MFS transporter [Methanogenium organophilum]|uniref:MFS transporter n=1 Tax=Methanogenium organophilum TaxID=2199 RepID=A0A9X9S652_METOG|nr:MFS transporter [Methanogenium organophilum]WAI02130.1 MFS transporter [Methanogenium organophilum]
MEIPTEVTNQKLLLFAISIAAFMSALDSSIVNIALPTISTSFDVSTGLVSWVSTMYLLVLTSCLMIFGKLSDRIGFRRIFLSGFLVFAAGSLFCALSPSFLTLVGSRALQAVGGAMLGAISMAMVSVFLPAGSRAKAIGFVVTMSSLGVAAGPFLGGILTEMLSWHWIFLINVPVGILACLLGAAVIPSLPARETTVKFDWQGALFLFITLASLIYALNLGVALGFTSPPIITAGVIFIVGVFLFIRRERCAPDPLLDLQLYRRRDFLFANLGALLMMFAYCGSNFLLPFFLEYVQGMSTMVAGIFLTVPSVTLMLGGTASGALYHRFGPRKLCVGASAIYLVSFLLLSTFGVATSTVVIVLTLALLGFGLGFYYSPNTSEIMCLAPREKQGMVSSLATTERNAGATVGIVIFELALIQSLISITNLEGLTEGALASQPQLLEGALASAFDIAFFVGAVVAFIVIILSFFTPDPENVVECENEEAGMMV